MYTQYQNIVLQGDADLIVGDGDDFIPDILGIGTDVDTPGILGNGEGKVRVDNITDKSGVKAPKFPYGLGSSCRRQYQLVMVQSNTWNSWC